MAINYNDGSSVKAINYNGNDVKVVKVEDSNNPNGVVAWSKPMTTTFNNFDSVIDVKRTKGDNSEPTSASSEYVYNGHDSPASGNNVYFGDTLDINFSPNVRDLYQTTKYIYEFSYANGSYYKDNLWVYPLFSISSPNTSFRPTTTVSLTNTYNNYNNLFINCKYNVYTLIDRVSVSTSVGDAWKSKEVTLSNKDTNKIKLLFYYDNGVSTSGGWLTRNYTHEVTFDKSYFTSSNTYYISIDTYYNRMALSRGGSYWYDYFYKMSSSSSFSNIAVNFSLSGNTLTISYRKTEPSKSAPNCSYILIYD